MILQVLIFGIIFVSSPLLAWDDNETFKNPDPNRRSSVIDYGHNKTTEDSFYGYQQLNSIKVDSIQEANERQRRQMDAFAEQNRRLQQEQEKGLDKLRKDQEAKNNEWEAKRWRLQALSALASTRIISDTSIGMGVVIGDGRTVVTCAHVVGSQKKVTVKSGLGTMEGTILAIDKAQDVAILSIPLKHIAVKLNRSSQLMPRNSLIMAAGIGDDVMDMDMRPGEVLAHFIGPSPNYIMSCLPKPGYSGGPVLDSNGYLVGLIQGFAYLDNKEGMNVIPAYKIERLAQREIQVLEIQSGCRGIHTKQGMIGALGAF